ncbi:putative electron transfer flavoprotein subunit alpha, mitochondrial [Vanrija pseudolonga]|uniref:Probable electron transfer flavoprotein subunit alpha n=1 Tax=Vanrija pseudolonga TaxID=143232 RepID=A0AAF0Y7D4_9TREE|nr:putative electron transfer flavoprotein subunit alpha, mitochondrial [Vanrija pseudolonga]
MLFRSVARTARTSSAIASSSLSTAAQRRLASSLVFLEQKGGKLSDSALTAVTAAKQVGGDVAGIVVGSKADVDSVLEQAKKIDGLSKVYAAASDSLAHGVAENVAPVLAEVVPAKSITHLFGAHTPAVKNVFPRLAGILGVSQISDIIALEGEDVFSRPVYAGNAILKLKSSDKDAVKVVTVRTTAFAKAAAEGGSAAVEEVAAKETDSPTKFVSEEIVVSSRPDLGSAAKVVSGGRALKSQDSFNTVLDPLADALGAAVGASRAAVDAGYADNSLQVGQTGKVVAPELYIAIGISGAIQHLAGMKDSKLIVAINKDADAPIFQVADVGLVADLFDAVPELVKEIEAAKK